MPPSPSSPPPAQGIFISYRRDDTAYAAGWLFDRLSDRFGAAQIFKDIDSIEPGDDFVDTINAAVASCDILLALIGDQWLTAAGLDGRRRLDDPNDFVRLEIEAALARDIRVIPVLVEDARMPSAGELPPSLAGLLRRQALELSPTRFAADLGRLVRVVEATLAPTGPDGRAGSVARLRSALSGPRRVAAVVAAAIVVVILIVALAARDGSSPADGGDTPSEEEPAPEEDSSGWALPLVMAAGPALGGQPGRRRPAPGLLLRDGRVTGR
jgi:hypothetical protein